MPLGFAIDPFTLPLLLAFTGLLWLAWKWREDFVTPSLLFSNIKDLSAQAKGLKARFAYFPRWLEWAALALFLIAFLDPHFFREKKAGAIKNEPPKEGIALYLLVDQSGSMEEEVTATMPDESYKRLKKIDLLKMAATQFVNALPNDLIGLISFARRVQIQAPLTLDHKVIVQDLNQLQTLITEDEGGTSIGYAVYKAVNLIVGTKHFAQDLRGKGKPAYDIKNIIIVMITDGFQNVNAADVNNPLRSMDVEEAAKFAKANDVKFYVVNVDPSITSNEFTPQRRLMERVTAMTGGHFYIIDSANSLDKILTKINQLEGSRLPVQEVLSKQQQPERYQRISLYSYLIACGIFFLLFSLLLQTTLLRRAP